MRPSESGSSSSLAVSRRAPPASSSSSPGFFQPKPRLILAPVYMATCMAAPSEALAHLLGFLVRGAHSAMIDEVLLPQANSSSDVPVMRNRSPATKEAAA